MSFSALALREQLVTILRSQVRIAFSHLSHAAHDATGWHEQQLARAKDTYDSAVRLRRKVDLEGEDTDDIDRSLERLVEAICQAEDRRCRYVADGS